MGNKRGRRCFVDYLLHKDSRHLALIEAKKEGEHPTKGLQQAIGYASKLGIRFLFSTNGPEIYEFDLQSGSGRFVDHYPSPSDLLDRYEAGYTDQAKTLRAISFHIESGKTPYYYQELAVHAATDAIGNGMERILLTLATGTGKTFIAFQIVHKLFEARWNLSGLGERRPRVLFLADRNVLADQAINTFNSYEGDLIKINGDEVRRRNGVVPTNAHLFFAIYQAIAEREDIGGYYKEYPKDFFDLIVIDECHRGAANEEGSWRAILDHFKPAVHLGLTATPKRSDNIDTYNYFGKPVYEYALTTGVDARNVRNIVLDRNIGSMVEFKQIVGRGTRVFEGKDYFTIIDFRGATNLFYDPEWDGTIDEPEPDEVGDPPGGGGGGPGPEPPEETLDRAAQPHPPAQGD